MMMSLMAAMLFAQGAPPAPAEAQVLAPVQAMFDGLARHDRAAMLAEVLPEGTTTSIADGKVRQMSLGAFVAGLPDKGPALEERLYAPLVRIDGDVAMVWGAYDFRVDGKVSHCGSDAVTLVRRAGAWKIASITWNQRKDCTPA